MGKALGHHITTGLALQRVVTDGRGGGESLFDIALFEHVAGPVGMVGPDPGQAVRLQFHAYLDLVGLGFGDAPLGALDLF